MKLASFRSPRGEDFGIVADDRIYPASELLGDSSVTLAQILREASARDQLEEATSTESISFSLDSVQLLPAVPNPPKIICVGLNYGEHAAEAGRNATAGPALFVRFPESQAAGGAEVPVPPKTALFDYEGEFAVVMGQIASGDVRPVAYGCYNDFTSRDWQRHSTQWTAGKNFPGTGAFGPTITTAKSFTPNAETVLETRVNGEVRQHARLGEMIYSINELLDYISTFTTLVPGDVIVTGTPAGAGAFSTPPRSLAPGDEVAVSIDGLDPLKNVISI